MQLNGVYERHCVPFVSESFPICSLYIPTKFNAGVYSTLHENAEQKNGRAQSLKLVKGNIHHEFVGWTLNKEIM